MTARLIQNLSQLIEGREAHTATGPASELSETPDGEEDRADSGEFRGREPTVVRLDMM